MKPSEEAAIPDAAVEAAAKGMWDELHDQPWDDAEEDARLTYRIEAQAALSAALPMLAPNTAEQSARADERRKVYEEVAANHEATEATWLAKANGISDLNLGARADAKKFAEIHRSCAAHFSALAKGVKPSAITVED